MWWSVPGVGIQSGIFESPGSRAVAHQTDSEM